MSPQVVDPTAVTIRCCRTCHSVFRTDFLRCPNDGSAIELSDHDPLIGRTVGSYVVDAFLGDGAVGRVYRVHHERLEHRQLALKVLIGDFAASVSMRMRFAQEAAAASRLEHPNVVSVVDFGKSDTGLLFLAMELVDGVALSNLIGDRPLPTRRVLALARQMCLGLQHAHGHGLIHRDFKPDNVLVVAGPHGEVPRIADFGLAISSEQTTSDLRLTGAGATVGTPAYAAPEQVYGNAIDHRADLFALGVTMFEMLAGAVPFDGSPIEVMHLNATAAPPAIRELAPESDVPPRLEHLVRRMMSAQPAMRPSSVASVISELDRIKSELKSNSRATPLPVAAVRLTPVPGAPLPREASGARALPADPVAREASGARAIPHAVEREPSGKRGTASPFAATAPAPALREASGATPLPVARDGSGPRAVPAVIAREPSGRQPLPAVVVNAQAALADDFAGDTLDGLGADVAFGADPGDIEAQMTTRVPRYIRPSTNELVEAYRPRRSVIVLAALTIVAVIATVAVAFQRASSASSSATEPRPATTSRKDDRRAPAPMTVTPIAPDPASPAPRTPAPRTLAPATHTTAPTTAPPDASAPAAAKRSRPHHDHARTTTDADDDADGATVIDPRPAPANDPASTAESAEPPPASPPPAPPAPPKVPSWIAPTADQPIR